MHQLLQLKGKELLFWWHVSLALCQRCERCTSFLYKVSVFEPLISRTCVLFPAYQVKKKKKKKKFGVGLLISFSLLRRQCALSHRNVFAPQSDENVKYRLWRQCDAVFFFFCIVLAKILQTWQRVVNAAVQGVLQNNECALHSSLVLTDSALRIDSS